MASKKSLRKVVRVLKSIAAPMAGALLGGAAGACIGTALGIGVTSFVHKMSDIIKCRLCGEEPCLMTQTNGVELMCEGCFVHHAILGDLEEARIGAILSP